MKYNDDIEIDLWEIGGSSNIRPHWKNIYKNVDGIVYVVDSSDQGRLAESTKALKEVLKAPQLDKLPIMVLAHKSDVDGAASEDDI